MSDSLTPSMVLSKLREAFANEKTIPLDDKVLRSLCVNSSCEKLRREVKPNDFDLIIKMLHHDNCYVANLGQALLRPFIETYGKGKGLLPSLLSLWGSTQNHNLKAGLLFDIFLYKDIEDDTAFAEKAFSYLEENKCLIAEMLEEWFEGKENLAVNIDSHLGRNNDMPLKTALWLFSMVSFAYDTPDKVKEILGRYSEHTAPVIQRVRKFVSYKIEERFKRDVHIEEMNQKWLKSLEDLKDSLNNGARSTFLNYQRVSDIQVMKNPRVFINIRNRHLSYPKSDDHKNEIPSLQWRYAGLRNEDFVSGDEALKDTLRTCLSVELFGGMFMSSSFKIEEHIKVIKLEEYFGITDDIIEFDKAADKNEILTRFLSDFVSAVRTEFGDRHPRNDTEEKYLRQILNYKLNKYFAEIGGNNRERWAKIIKLIERRYLFTEHEVKNAVVIMHGLTFGVYYPIDIFIVLCPEEQQNAKLIEDINTAIEKYKDRNLSLDDSKAISIWDLPPARTKFERKARMALILLERTFSHLVFQLFAKIYSLYFSYFISKGKNQVITHGLSAILAAPISEGSIQSKRESREDEILIDLDEDKVLSIPYPVYMESSIKSGSKYVISQQDSYTYKEISRYKVKTLLTKLEEYYNDILNEQKKLRMKDAVVAIMGRNISHNIGSHVLAGVTELYDNMCSLTDDDFARNIAPAITKEHFRKAKNLYKYLQQRNDLIAQLSTSVPTWTLDMNLGEIIKEFEDQKYLLDFIAHFRELADGKKIDSSNIEIEHKGLDSLEIAIPTGNIGTHAFYSILENIIRNAARHGVRDGQEKLSLSIVADNSNDRFYKIIITDNCGNGRAYGELNQKLKASILDEGGRLRTEDWGMKEKKISASYLRLISPEAIDETFESCKANNASSENPFIIMAKNDTSGNLGYELFLLKAKKALVISTSQPENISEFKEMGIDYITPIDFERIDKRKIIHKFLVIDNASLNEPNEWLGKHVLEVINTLPYKICVKGAIPDMSLFENIIVTDNLRDDTPLNLYNDLVEKWTSHFWTDFKIAERGAGSTTLRDKLTGAGCEAIPEKGELSEVNNTILFDHDKINGADRLYSRVRYHFPFDMGHPLWKEVIKKIIEYPYLKSELIEMGATRIAIVDSRIWETRSKVFNCSKYSSIEHKSFISWWKKKGVDILDVDFAIKDFNGFVRSFIEKSQSEKYHFLVFHQGEIDEIRKRDGSKFEGLWNTLKSAVICTVIDTGRGVPAQARKDNLRWIPYSILQEYLIHKATDYMAKKKLIESLTSTKAEAS